MRTRISDGHTRGQASQQRESLLGAVGEYGAATRHHRADLGDRGIQIGGEHPMLFERERLRHDADDGVLRRADAQHASDHRRVAAKAILPGAM